MSVGRLLSISVLIVFVLGPVSLVAHGAEGGHAGSRLTPREVRQLLASHNRARTEVGLSPLAWSTKLAVYAQEWADHLASTSRRMEHRPHSGRWKQEHGENLFMGTAGYYGVADAVAMWEGEKRVYDGRAIDQYGVHSFGHYTQLIWRGTEGRRLCKGILLWVHDSRLQLQSAGQRAGHEAVLRRFSRRGVRFRPKVYLSPPSPR